MSKQQAKLFTTSLGDALYLALRTKSDGTAPSLKYKSTDREYVARVAFDTNTQEGMETLKLLESINAEKIRKTGSLKSKGEQGVNADGIFHVNFTSKYAPIVYNAEGQALDNADIPIIGKAGWAHVKVMFTVIEKDQMSFINLKGIQILDHEAAVASKPKLKDLNFAEIESKLKNSTV